jgi:hypothetical protein
MKSQTTIQQGDVILRRIALPHIITSISRPMNRGKKLVLSKGETTGHSHVLEVEETEAELIEMGGNMILQLENAGVLTHEEHKPVEVPPGTYEVAAVAEYDYANQIVEQVRD